MLGEEINMSNSMLNTLLELFPEVSEEFLSGICSAYNDEEVTVDELVEVILSFEFKPPREFTNEHNEGSHNGPIILESEVIEPQLCSLVNDSNVQPIDEVLQQSASVGNATLSPDCTDPLEKFSGAKQPDGSDDCISNELSNGMIHENNGTTSDPSRNVVVNECNENTSTEYYMNNAVQCEQSNENNDSSPECSIQYLMQESSTVEICDITTEEDKPGENLGENRKFVPHNGILSNDSSQLTTKPSGNQASSHNKSSQTKQRKIYQKRPNCSNTSQNGTCHALPHSSNKRVTLRSCKVKNEEERLRRRLVNQSRLIHERAANNVKSLICNSQFLDVDKKYTLLCNIFPDADPTYLLDQCEFLTDQEKILAFISQNLELRDYPKIDVKEERKLMEEFCCTVAEFVEVIPDPMTEFASANYIRVGYEENAEIYLKARYNLSSDDVKERLRACSYNLTFICAQLEDEGRLPIPGVLDYTPLHHPANVWFHQEVWYIEHRKEVQDYLDSAIEAIRMQEELNMPPPPPPPEEVFECEICTEEIVDYTELGTCDGPTGHLFCVNCIKRSVEVKMGDGATTFPCLVNCGSFIPLQTVEELLPQHIFEKLMGRIQEEEIRKANISGVETCPFCPYAYGPGTDDLFICLNPGCMKLSCRVCCKEDHSPDMCEKWKNEDEESARHIIEERMAEALMRTCYSCGRNFVKTEGCNMMHCECGAKMCYVCRQPVQDYSHFNGEGGDNTDKCPLFSEFNELHDRPVEATAEQVFNEIAASNPHLNLDRNKLIPK